MEAESLLHAVVDTISELVAKRIADTLSCVEAKEPVKTKSTTVVAVEAYTGVDTLNEVEAETLVYTQAHTFPQVEAKSVTDTLVEGISYIISVRQ